MTSFTAETKRTLDNKKTPSAVLNVSTITRPNNKANIRPMQAAERVMVISN